MSSHAWRVRDSRESGLALLHGVRVRYGANPVDALVRIRAAAVALPAGGVIGGWAAEVVRGVPALWADGRGPRGEPLPVPVMVARPATPYVRRGFIVRQARLAPDDVTQVDGISITSGVRTVFDRIRFSATLGEAVAAGDLGLRFGLTTCSELEAYVSQRPRWRGVGRVRAALPLLDARSESPPESVVRTIWERSGLGLPEPQVVVADQDGRPIARVDLLDREAGIAGEYQGAWHREGSKPWQDTSRMRALDAVGIEVVEFWAADVATPRVIEEALVLAYRRAGRRPRAERTYLLSSTRPPIPRIRRT